MWAQREDKEFWLNWLNRYKSLKCLWDEDAKREAGRNIRQAAYQELAELAKSINVNADVAFVRGRINAFRTSYRREARKVQVAKENGCVYEPQLFYYKTLDFLNDSSDIFDSKNFSEYEEDNDPIDCAQQNEQRMPKMPHLHPGDKTLTIKKKLNDCLGSDHEMSYMAPSKINKITASASKQKYSHSLEPTDSLDCDGFQLKHSAKNISIATIENVNDEYEILGRRIAAHFRNMNPSQRLIAEKIISDVCIYGRMQKLTMNSTVYIDSTETENIAEQKDIAPQSEVDYDNPDTFIYTA